MRMFLMITMVALLADCATAQNWLNPPSSDSESVTKLNVGQYELEVTGERSTNTADLMTRFRQLAQKLCDADHFDTFETDAQVATANDPSPANTGANNPEPSTAFFRESSPAQIPQTARGHVTCVSFSSSGNGRTL